MKLLAIVSKTAAWLDAALFPHYCAGCREEGEILCEKCVKSVQPVLRATCPFCSSITDGVLLCGSCRETMHLSHLLYISDYRKRVAQHIVHALKYSSVRDLIPIIGYLMAAHGRRLVLMYPDLVLVPIPIHRRRLGERGFNQAAMIAQDIAKRLVTPYMESLIRVHVTRSQVGLTREERMENIKNAFALRDDTTVSGRTICLVDDVCTSGATLREAARVLREAGAKEVIGFTFAHGEVHAQRGDRPMGFSVFQ